MPGVEPRKARAVNRSLLPANIQRRGSNGRENVEMGAKPTSQKLAWDYSSRSGVSLGGEVVVMNQWRADNNL